MLNVLTETLFACGLVCCMPFECGLNLHDCNKWKIFLSSYFKYINLTLINVSKPGLWQSLHNFHCPEKFILMFRRLYLGMAGWVSISGALSDLFPNKNDLKEECGFIWESFSSLEQIVASTNVFETVMQRLLYTDDCDIEHEADLNGYPKVTHQTEGQNTLALEVWKIESFLAQSMGMEKKIVIRPFEKKECQTKTNATISICHLLTKG